MRGRQRTLQIIIKMKFILKQLRQVTKSRKKETRVITITITIGNDYCLYLRVSDTHV